MIYMLAMDCQDSGFLEIVLFVKNVIEILQIVTPILLIISVMLDCMKNVTDKEGYNKKIMHRIFFKFLAAASIFFVLPLTNLVLSIFGEEPIQKHPCFENANKEYIENRKKAETAVNNGSSTNKKFVKYLEKELKKRHKIDFDRKYTNTVQNENTNESVNTDHKGERVSFTNFPYYNQAAESTYGTYPYCSGGYTLHTDGCGVFSFSVIASGLVDVNYTPDVVAKWICSNIPGQGNGVGTYSSVFDTQTLSNHFGLKTQKIAKMGKEDLRKYLNTNLKQNNGMIINVPHHYIAVVRSTHGKYAVLDSAQRQLTNEYDYDEFYNTFLVNYRGRGSWWHAWLVSRR